MAAQLRKLPKTPWTSQRYGNGGPQLGSQYAKRREPLQQPMSGFQSGKRVQFLERKFFVSFIMETET